MALVPGTRLGPYEIASALGEGGMGVVYRALDTKLKRQVALKVLPASVADDPDRLARFQREAELLASLNHPHIAQIYGLEGGALVMELVEGPTLADRIAQGVFAPDEALPIATQIGDALAAAHDRGIVHRDLKPANIKVRPDGTVKLLDFGLAKAVEPAGVGAGSGLSLSPTMTSPAMPFDWRSGHPEPNRGVTQAGMLLGTAPYMSPEQARGKAVDKRADIWAFGCVLFEMVTGRRAFGGDTVTDTITAIMRDQPDLSLAPREVRRLLAGCLERTRAGGSATSAMSGRCSTTPPTCATLREPPHPGGVAHFLGVSPAPRRSSRSSCRLSISPKRPLLPVWFGFSSRYRPKPGARFRRSRPTERAWSTERAVGSGYATWRISNHGRSRPRIIRLAASSGLPTAAS